MYNHYQSLISGVLMLMIACAGTISLSAQEYGGSEKEVKNIFVVFNTGEEMQYFKPFAQQMARLKPFGRVDVTINSPALKGDFECPEGSCDWH